MIDNFSHALKSSWAEVWLAIASFRLDERRISRAVSHAQPRRFVSIDGRREGRRGGRGGAGGGRGGAEREWKSKKKKLKQRRRRRWWWKEINRNHDQNGDKDKKDSTSIKKRT